MGKKGILFIESCFGIMSDGQPLTGGSHLSLLSLIQGLNQERFNIVVLFWHEYNSMSELIPDFQKAGAKVIFLPQRFSPIYKIENLSAKDQRYKSEDIALFEKVTIIIRRFVWLKKLLQQPYDFLTLIFPLSREIIKIIKQEKIDMVCCNNGIVNNQSGILAAFLARKGCVCIERNITEQFSLTEKILAKLLDTIVAVSYGVKENMKKLEINQNKIKVIYNAIESKIYTNVKRKKQDVFYEFNLNLSCPLIGMVGSVLRWKGQEILLLSLNRLRQTIPTIKCLIVGAISKTGDAKEYFDELKELIKEYNMEDNVIFTGYRTDITDLMNAMDVIVHASITPEPFGRVILEGLLLEKPFIAANAGGPKEIIKHGETGLLYHPGDDIALSEGILWLLNHSKEAKEMGRKGKEWVLEKFDIKKRDLEYTEVFEKLLANTKK